MEMNSKLNEKIEGILREFENKFSVIDVWYEIKRNEEVLREHYNGIKDFISKSLTQFAQEITAEMLVEIEKDFDNLKIEPLREKREGVRGHIINLCLSAIKAKRDKLLNL